MPGAFQPSFVRFRGFEDYFLAGALELLRGATLGGDLDMQGNSILNAVVAFPVDSVFGRVGAVVSAVGDYDASQIDNDSGVPGANVAAALDLLSAASAPVNSVFGRIGAVIAAASDYDASQIDNDSVVVGATVADALNTLAGGGGPVTSVFGRSGAVVGALSDYDASQIDNDSGVAGATVADALDTLAGGGGPVTSVFGRSGAVVAALNDYSASQINNDSGVSGAEVSDALDNLAAAIVVDSVFGRTGAVVAAASDYDASQVDNDSGVAGAFVSDALDTLAGLIPAVPVDSVFGRVGAVVAAVSDYAASQVDNDSGVAGATVADALDNLAAGSAPVDSVFGRIGAVVAAASDYDASQVDNDSVVTGAFVSDALNRLAALDVPKTDSYGVSTPAPMTGPLVLGNSSPTVQFLDPNGLDRKVSFPTLGIATPYFVLVNIGSLGSLLLAGSNGSIVDEVPPGMGARYWAAGATGTRAHVSLFTHKSVPVTAHRQSYAFGNNMNAVGRYAVSNGRADEDLVVNVASHISEQSVADTGNITHVSYSSNQGTPGGFSFEVMKNGIATGGIVSSAIQYNTVAVTPIPVATTDGIALIARAATQLPVRMTAHVLVEPTSKLGQCNFHYGAFFNGANDYLRVSGVYNDADPATLDASTEVAMPWSGRLTKLSHRILAHTPGLGFSVVKNGIVSETVILGAVVSGTTALPTGTEVLAGDRVALQWNNVGGSNGTFSLVAERFPLATLVHYAGAPGTSTQLLKTNGIDSSGTDPVPGDARNRAATRAVVLRRASVHQDNDDGDRQYNVYKNGILASFGSVGAGGGGVVKFMPPVVFSIGDSVAVGLAGTVTPNNLNLQLLMEDR